jgi:DNA-binding NtrC family response regulator
VICATGCDLRDRIKQGRFLEDLYYRLNDISIRVPSLRERREDVPVLAQHFLAHYSKQMEKRIGGLAPDIMKAFLEYEWRGNVRELEKTIKRLVVLADDGDTLDASMLPSEMRDAGASPAEKAAGTNLRSNVSQLERKMIAQALERHHWNKARTARELGLSYPTLLTKIRTFKIERRSTAR